MIIATHAYKGARAILRVEPLLASLEVVGPYDADTCRGILAGLAGHIQTPPLAAVLCYERAEILSPLLELTLVAQEFQHAGVQVKTPAALLVNPDMLAKASAHCRELRNIGYSRAAFTDSREAHSWAASRAALLERFLAN